MYYLIVQRLYTRLINAIPNIEELKSFTRHICSDIMLLFPPFNLLIITNLILNVESSIDPDR
jgi:hypothetical protein